MSALAGKFPNTPDLASSLGGARPIDEGQSSNV